MNAVIIYDQFDVALKASTLLQDAAAEAGTSVGWHIQPWQMEQLLSKSSRKLALQDAVEAHLLLLAFRSPAALPSRLFVDWLEQWAASRTVEDAILSAFDTGDGASIEWQLDQFRERHGLKKLCEHVDVVRIRSDAGV